MSTASYQSPNNYNLVEQIRPFNLPYESSMKEISMKSEYFKQGLDRVKSIYDQAVGLDPQFAQNKEYLKTFMNDANKKISKLTRSDLSISDNSGQAANIFKPLYDTSNKFNRGLLTDSQLNKFYRQQEELANTYRTKDGGKQWSQDNEFYFRDAQQKYLSDAKAGNLDSLDGHFQSKKGYIPYYDYKQEMLDIQDACKGQSYQNKGVSVNNEMYFQENSKKGCNPDELALAYKTALSGQARQQMGIEGYSRFKGNEDELAKQFTDIYVNKAEAKLAELKATYAGLTSGGVTEANKEKAQFYADKIAEYEPEVKKSRAEFDDMTKGNVIDYVKRNYDRLAGQVHFGNVVSQAGQALRTDENKNLVTTNAAGMLKYKSEVDRTNMYIQADIDSKFEEQKQAGRIDLENLKSSNDFKIMEAKNALENGQGGSNSPQAAVPVTTENINLEPISESKFIEENLKPAKKRLDDSYSVINHYVKSAIGNGKDLTHGQLVNYITAIENREKAGEVLPQNDKDILSAYKNYKSAKDDLQYNNDRIEAVNNQVKNTNPELFNYNNISDEKVQGKVNVFINGKEINVPNAPSLSKRDMVKLFSGETINGYYIRDKKDSPRAIVGSTLTMGTPSTNGGIVSQLYFNGNEVNLDASKKIGDLFRSASISKANNINEINKLKTDLYTKKYYENSPFTVFDRAAFGKEKDWKDKQDYKFRSLLGVPGGLGEKDGYEIAFRDRTGEGVWLRLLDEDGKPKSISTEGGDAVLARLKSGPSGAGVLKKDIQGGVAYYVPNVFPRYQNLPSGPELEKFNRLKEHMLDIQTNIQSNPQLLNQPVFDSRSLSTGGTSRYSAPSGRDYLISVRIERGQAPRYIATYTVRGTNQEESFEASTIDALSAKLQ